MAKEKISLYEEIEFDDVQLAIDTYNQSKAKMKKVKKGFTHAIIATVCNAIGWIPTFQGKEETPLMAICILVGLVSTIIAYVKGGGIGRALGWIGKFAVLFGIWFVFPFNLLAGFVGLCVGFWVVYGAPILIVYMNYNQVKMDYESAKRFVSYYKVKQAKEQQAQQRAVTRQASYQSDYGRTQQTNERGQAYQTQSRTYGDRTSAYSSRTTSSARTSNQSYQGRGRSY